MATATKLGDLSGVHPDIWDLPIEALDGDHESVGNLDAAGKAAAFVYENWPDDTWRNAFLMGLAQHIENQVVHHRVELNTLRNQAKEAVYKRGRRAIVKTYLGDVMQEMVAKSLVSKDTEHVRGYYRSDGTKVSGYDREQAASMAAALLMANRKPNAGANAEFVIRHKNGKVRTERPDGGQTPKLKRGERIIQIRNLGADNPQYAAGNDTFNVATALGANSAQAGSAGAIAQEMSRQGNIRYNADGTNNWFGRLESASETLHHASNNGRVQTAAAVGKYVGKHGPEATKVVGPHMRRMSYKYRGDAAPASQWTAVARLGRQSDNKGNQESVDAFQHKLALSLQMPRSEGGLDAIPTEEQEELLLNTGSTAPSHGYILNHKGEVKQQAKGIADDHYTPFNIKDFHHLNKGSYVRSRAFGGPTTDDFATALKTGAKSFSVISRNGIYKVNFTPQTDKSGKKVGAWAKDTAGDGNHDMVTRYGKLLDAVGHGKVRDPATGQSTILNGHGYDLALQSLKRQFPYQIKSVEYTPSQDTGTSGEGQRASRLQSDTGYVRPFYLKPGAARQGYHDPLLGGTKSFDELDAYRMGRARALASRESFRQEWIKRRANETQDEYDRRMQRGPTGVAVRGTSGSAPTTLSTHQAQRYGAVAGEYGARQYSTPATRNQVDNPDKWSRIQTKAYLNTVRAFLDHVEPGPDEADAHQLHEKLQWEGDPRNEGDWDEFVDQVQNNTGGIRGDIYDILDTFQSRYLNDQADPHGLNLWRKSNQEARDNDASLPDYRGVPAERQEQQKSEDDLREDKEVKDYQDFRRLFHPNGAYEQISRNPNAPKDTSKFRNMEIERNTWKRPVRYLDGTEQPSKYETWTQPDPDYDGLAKWQWIENRIALAQGNKPPHQIPDDYVPEPEKSSTAVTEDTNDREAEEAAQRYMQQQMKDLNQGDIDGWG